ncbi:MAG TPA: hypothetical protein VN643_14310 [Pyrinomonadaceae bacterium]|nr:hypothetical protein [Pyrinomonadaceae bacterium]
MARTLFTTESVFRAGLAAGVTAERIRSRRDQQLTVTVPEVQSSGNVVAANPWPNLIGKYKNDPTWEGFDDFLKEYRAQVDHLHNAGTDSE